MKTIGAAKFKEQCLALLDRLDADGLVVTKHGKPVCPRASLRAPIRAVDWQLARQDPRSW